MSNVSTQYSLSSSQNVRLGGLSLKENETRYRDLNDLFRALMADARQESDEVRTLLASSDAKAADARAIASAAQSEAAAVTASTGAIATQASNAESAAAEASATAAAAQEVAEGLSARIAATEATASDNASSISSLTSRVSSLENASASSATLVQVDGTTVSNSNGVLKAIDVKVGETTASALGQIGRSAVSTGADLDGIIADGWYAVGGENADGLPDGITSGVCHVSSGYVADSVFQSLFVPGEMPRMFVRSTDDGGEVWGDWHEAVFAGSVGTGLTFVNGVLSADMSEVLPEASTDDADKALSGAGAWMEVAHPADVQAAFEEINALEESLDTLRAEMETLQGGMGAEPDGVTVIVEDGQYTVPNYDGATDSTDGMAGLVPAAPAGSEGLFLRGDGTWADPRLSTASYDGTTAGLVSPADEGEQDFFLRGDGTWANPCETLEERVSAVEEWDWQGLSERVGELESFATTAQIDALWGIETPEEPKESGGEGGE